MADRIVTLELPKALESALASGHPWIYRDHVPSGFRARSGTFVRVKAGRFVGYALWDERSPIALRIFSERGVPDAAWIEERVRAAWQLRSAVRADRTTAYRLLSGEGDGLPGLVVDVYGPFAVVVSYADAVDTILPWAIEAVRKVADEAAPLEGVLRRRSEERAGALEILWGKKPPKELVVEEHGVRLPVDLESAQKTGLFLDQRENRRYVAALAPGRRVLNLFSYTGGFSIPAALAGAVSVTSVDSAAGAIAQARRTFELNGIDPAAHAFEVADAFEWLEAAVARRERFDLVICDPPSFARSKGQLIAARKAYVRLNALALRVTAPGGFCASSSCTAQITPDMFRDILVEAASRSRVRLQIVHDVGQPLDHPIMAAHREGRYLKFVVGRVLKIV